MYSPNRRQEYAAVAMIQSSLAGAMAASVPLAAFRANNGTNLLCALRAGHAVPRGLTLDFSPLLDVLKLQMLGASPSLQNIIDAISGPNADLVDLLEDDRPGVVLNRIRDFFSNSSELANLAALLDSFLDGQFAIALSLITTFKNFADEQFPRVVRDAVLDYFLGEEGYVTIEQLHISVPLQSNGLRGLAENSLPDKTARRYVCDLIELTVDAAGDLQYQLRERYQRMLTGLSAVEGETARRWFKGFAAMAESGVTASVEETLLNVGQFAANPLISAAAGAYAGTVARKATQHVFLSELGV